VSVRSWPGAGNAVVSACRWLLPAGLAFGVLVGCATTVRQQPPLSPTPEVYTPENSATLDQYVASIKANSDRSDHESDGKTRAELAMQSSNMADACLALNGRAAACQYGKALATGMEARAHPTQALGLLTSMLNYLKAADAVNTYYDQAGPARVRALVLIRAPGWPLGPGDTDAGLISAREAVSLAPGYVPNQLALAEALSKNGDADGAHQSYQRALELAQAVPAGPERDSWEHDAKEGLAKK
jgi:tetratricopeptide (TPR) repeat protein